MVVETVCLYGFHCFVFAQTLFPFFPCPLLCAIAAAAAAVSATHDADADVDVGAVAVIIAICLHDKDGTHKWFFVNTICFVNILFYLRAKRNEKKFKIHISNYIRK